METTGAAFEGFGRDGGGDDESHILTVAILVYNVLACRRRSYTMLYCVVTLSLIATGLAVQELVVRWTMYFVNCPSIVTDSVIESLRSKLDPKRNIPVYVISYGSMPTVSGRYPSTLHFLNSRFRMEGSSSQG
jgi:hypothetical protein